MNNIVVNEEVHLAKISHNDTARLQEIANDSVLRRNMWDTFPFPYTLDDATWFINNCAEEWEKEYGERNYWIYVNNVYAGNLGFHQKKKWRELYNVHLWYWLWREYRGKGYMTGIVKKVLLMIDEEIPDRHRVYAKVVSSNPGSRKVLEKNWFSLEWTERESQLFEWERYDMWILSLVNNT